MAMRPFPSTDPFAVGRLKTSGRHEIHYEQHGNPEGVPVLALHGGPGAGISRTQLQTIDPNLFRICTFDQRGAGRSTPFAETSENTTRDLLDDIERLRRHLGIERWVVTGRSWGSTLAVAYAIEHPERIAALVPVAVFLGRKRDVDWLYQYGASEFFPQEWQQFVAPIPEDQRHDILSAIAATIASDPEPRRLDAARRLARWELSTCWLQRGERFEAMHDDERYVLATGLIETHYLTNGCFFPTDNWLLENAPKLDGLPGVIVHGRYDMNCRVSQAYELHQAWPNARLEIVENAGHAQDHEGNIDACIRALREVATVI